MKEYYKTSKMSSKQLWKHLKNFRDVKDNNCWEWNRAKSLREYGLIKYLGRTQSVHRLAFTLAKQQIPPDMCVLHRCDNPPCFNPAHLWLGSFADNNHDKIAKGRENYVAGEDHPGHKLKRRQVRKIRRLCARGIGQRAIANRFGVSQTLVSGISANLKWRSM